ALVLSNGWRRYILGNQEEIPFTARGTSYSVGVSYVDINKKTKTGLRNGYKTSHRKITKHAIELSKDPAYAIRMQMLFQEKKIKNQLPEDRLKEVQEEITELQKKYKAKTVHAVIIKQNISDLDTVDDPSELRN